MTHNNLFKQGAMWGKLHMFKQRYLNDIPLMSKGSARVAYPMLFCQRLAAVFMLIFTIGIGNVWGDKSTLTFTSACGGEGTADDNISWSIESDANESTFDNSRGIHYGTDNNNNKVQYITLTSESFGNTKTITKVEVEASGNNTPSLSVTVGGIAFGTTATGLTTTNTKYTFEPTQAQSGNTYKGVVIVDLRKSSQAKKALYVKSVAVTYTSSGGGSTYTVG